MQPSGAPPYLSTQHMSSRCCGTCAGLRRAGQSERKQARKALVLLERSSLARPNHRRRRLGQVHSRKHRAGTSSGVRADLALLLLHSFTITGGTVAEEERRGMNILEMIKLRSTERWALEHVGRRISEIIYIQQIGAD